MVALSLDVCRKRVDHGVIYFTTTISYFYFYNVRYNILLDYCYIQMCILVIGVINIKLIDNNTNT